jgi:hypothetical protein
VLRTAATTGWAKTSDRREPISGGFPQLFLSAEFSWEYDVECSHGFAINSTPWANASALDLFI